MVIDELYKELENIYIKANSNDFFITPFFYILSHNYQKEEWAYFDKIKQDRYSNSVNSFMQSEKVSNKFIFDEYNSTFNDDFDKHLGNSSHIISQKFDRGSSKGILQKYIEFKRGDHQGKLKEGYSSEEWNRRNELNDGDAGAEKPLYRVKIDYYDDVRETLKSFYENSKAEIQEMIKNHLNKETKKTSTKKDIEPKDKIEVGSDMPKIQPLNQILYGPPGTGKTYNTINKALEIIDSEFLKININNRDALKEKFEEYKEAGQIEFVTFHQSYGYEEFVEGIKAKSEDGNIDYRVESGIFKRLSEKAKENYVNSKKSSIELGKEVSIKQKLELFLNDSIENDIEFLKTKGGKFKIKDLNNDEIIIYTEDSNYSDKTLILLVDELFKILDSDMEIKNSRQMAKDIFNINNQRQKDTYYFSIYKAFQNRDFGEIDVMEIQEPLKNYILIIDEINRGNISKIFGELITLIEDSKRIGAKEEIQITLPYSNKSFGVPKNLYILGTMNTADRSIALMDTALRRRFVFEEMMPKPELLRDIELNGIDFESLLIKINDRIEYLYDRDHTIGHAYFMSLQNNPNLNELKNIFLNKIIPLLQEYFYDDWEKIRLVLGDNQKENEELQFIEVKKDIKPSSLFGNSDIDEKEIYELNLNAFENVESYIKIYE